MRGSLPSRRIVLTRQAARGDEVAPAFTAPEVESCPSRDKQQPHIVERDCYNFSDHAIIPSTTEMHLISQARLAICQSPATATFRLLENQFRFEQYFFPQTDRSKRTSASRPLRLLATELPTSSTAPPPPQSSASILDPPTFTPSHPTTECATSSPTNPTPARTAGSSSRSPARRTSTSPPRHPPATASRARPLFLAARSGFRRRRTRVRTVT